MMMMMMARVQIYTFEVYTCICPSTTRIRLEPSQQCGTGI